MLTSENSCAPSIHTKYAWNNDLKEAGLRYRFWNLKVQQLRDLPVTKPQMEYLQQLLNITEQTDNIEGALDLRLKDKKEYKRFTEIAQDLRQHEPKLKAKEHTLAGQTKHEVLSKMILDRERL